MLTHLTTSLPPNVRWLLVSLLAAVSLSASAVADEDTPNPYVWNPKTKSVSVFKNGYGFFIRQGEVMLRNGWGHATEVPPATFGTLAIYAEDENQLVDLVGVGDGELIRFDEIHSVDPASREAAKIDAIESAMSTSAKLKYVHDGQELEAEGIVKAISGGYVVLQHGNAAVAIAVREIVSVQRNTLPLRFHVVGQPNAALERAQVHMAYLRSGIVWVPEYTLKLIDDEFAELTLRGTLVNEAEDLVDCDVNFVVGVPHFVHTDLLSPVAVGRALRAMGSAMPAGSVPQQVMSQVMNRAAIANNSMRIDDPSTGLIQTAENAAVASILGSLPQAETLSVGDYSVYTKENLTVRKGERAVVTLMTQRIRYGHRYHWSTDGELQHRLTLENSTSTPWTTGPCLALSGSKPLCEDIIKYTPVAGTGELPVTTAINLVKRIEESETDRQLKSYEPQPGNFLDLVTVSGSLKIKSFEKRPVEVHIVKPVQGKPIRASHDGHISIDSDKLRLLERQGRIEWTLTLEPGQEYDLSYVFERYVPSN